MALDVASLTLDDSQASLASMPEELWRKVTSYLRAGANPTLTEKFLPGMKELSALAKCHQILQTWFVREEWEQAVMKINVVADLIFELMLFTSNHLLPPGPRKRADIDAVFAHYRAEEAALGTTYYDVTARYLRFLDDCWSDEAFVQAIRKLGLDAAHNFAKAMLSLHVTTRSLQSHADDPRPPGPTADNPSGGFEAFARSLM